MVVRSRRGRGSRPGGTAGLAGRRRGDACGVTVRNTGDRAGTEVVQLYLHDPVAQTTRPVVRLVGYARVPLEPGAAARVTFTRPRRPGLVHRAWPAGASSSPATSSCGFGRSSALTSAATVPLRLTGAERQVGQPAGTAPSVRVEPVVAAPALPASEARG